MAISFNEVKDLAKQRILEQQNRVMNKPLSERDLEDIQFCISEIERHIQECAQEGKQKFTYDCSTFDLHVFHALANAFKEENKLFFVLTSDGDMSLTVDWTGKHEV